MINLSPQLKLPKDAVTETIAILGRKGSGKTTTASVLAEELLSASLPLVVVDPTGAWWGLRSSKDGKGVGFPITILGGDHGDAPLEETAGKVIAELVAEEAPPLVLDLSALSKSAARRFVTDFGERLYEKNRTALHLVLDEADEFAPQRISKGMERCFGAIDTLVRRGRVRGVGVTMVTQRSAAINKDVLSQCEMLIAHRTSHPKDLEPILEWMKVHATPEQLQTVHGSIAHLKNGEAWVMSPQWMDYFKRIQVRDRNTFNSSATPKAGERRIVPKRLAPVDLKALEKRMASTIERAKASDPKLLHRRIAELEAQLKARPVEKPAKEVVKEVPVLKDGQLKRLERVVERAGRVGMEVTSAGIEIGIALDRARGRLPPLPRRAEPLPVLKSTNGVHHRTVTVASKPTNGELSLGKGELRILTAIAQHPEGVTREQLTVLTGYKRSTRDAYVQRLRMGGLIVDGPRIVATPAALNELGPDFQPLPTGSALLEHWRRTLPEGERVIFEVVTAVYPEAVEREVISEKTGYKRSTRDAYLQRLRARQLIAEEYPSRVRASETLFQ